MKRTRILPVGVLAIIVVLALATMGIVYTLWSDTLEINGTVETGFVDARMTLGVPYDVEVENKDVGRCLAVLVEGPIGGGNDTVDSGNDKVKITIENAYPSYHCYVPVDVENVLGGIPIKVQSPAKIDWDFSVEGVMTVTALHCWTGLLQLEGGEDSADVERYPNCEIEVHVLQAAAENAGGPGTNDPDAYTFTGQFKACQWNEADALCSQP